MRILWAKVYQTGNRCTWEGHVLYRLYSAFMAYWGQSLDNYYRVAQPWAVAGSLAVHFAFVEGTLFTGMIESPGPKY